MSLRVQPDRFGAAVWKGYRSHPGSRMLKRLLASENLCRRDVAHDVDPRRAHIGALCVEVLQCAPSDAQCSKVDAPHPEQ